MNIAFWNLNKQNHPVYVRNLLTEYNVDVLVMSEYKELNVDFLFRGLDDYEKIEPPGADKIVYVTRKTLNAKPIMGQSEYAAITVKGISEDHESNDNLLIIVGVHLEAMNQGEAGRDDTSRDIMADVVQAEGKYKTNHTVIIGDFNENPFDNEMIRHQNFNAVLFKDIIMRKESVKWKGKYYKRFYNPMLDYISEANKQYGSVYYDDRSRPLYWNCLDQVLVRKGLIEKLKGVKYIKIIGNTSLLTKAGIIDTKISDHLPLCVRIEC